MISDMQKWTPNVASIIEHAKNIYPEQEVVSRMVSGEIHKTNYKEVCIRSRKLASALEKDGYKKGDVLATLALNTYRHLEMYYGISGMGAITHTLNFRLHPEQAVYIINHAEDKIIFVETPFIPMMEALKDQLECVEKYIILCDQSEMPETTLKNAISYEEYIESGDENYEWPAMDDDAACGLCYTSGTTGNPKGVMLSHGGILSNCEGAQEILNSLVKDSEPVFLTWLPLSHSYEHAVQFVQITLGAKIYYAESLEKLLSNMSVAKPTIMTAVPRFYQNLYSKISINFSKQTGLKKKLISSTILLGIKKLNNENMSFREKILNYLCEKLVRQKIKNQFGGNLKAFVSGGGALDQKIGEFLNSIGLPTLQGYGLTEASPVVSCNIPEKIKIDTVGPPFKTNEVKIAQDGEILVKGENVMLGYWNMKKETDDILKNGWLHTGDIGEITKEGNLKITDRKKEIIVNSGGDNISPSKIENLLCLDDKIKQSFVYGDKKTYLVALIVSDSEKNKKEIELYIDDLNKNLSLVERVKKIKLINDEFTIENGMLTPTLKLKRKKILEKYKEDLEKLY